MRAKTIAALIAAATILVVLGIPAGASAKPLPREESATIGAEFHGRAANGFQFAYLGSRSRFNVLWFLKSASPGTAETVAYLVRPRRGSPTFKAGVLDARIGQLGHFHAHFVPTSTRTQPLEKGCTGDPTIEEKGFFVGSFSFRGERGYTAIHSHRERGTVSRQGARTCREPSGGKHRRHRPSRQVKERREREREREASDFRLLAGDAKGDVTLTAERQDSVEPEQGSPTTFQATATKRIGRLLVSRIVSVFDFGKSAATTFVAPELAGPPTEAMLTPPAPFSGSATFHLEGPKQASWTGDLAVELPGLGPTPLTGEGISAGACRGPTHCTKTLPPALQPVLETRPGVAVVGKATTTPPS